MPAKKSAVKKKAVAKKAPAKKAGAGKRGPKPGRTMSDEHKAALASGRTAGRAVRHYLEALETHRPKRGRKRTPESISARLAKIDESLGSADPMTRLVLVQEQLDLQNQLATLEHVTDLAALEADFVANAKTYAQSKGISYTAFRTVGVPAEVLRAAGITRGTS